MRRMKLTPRLAGVFASLILAVNPLHAALRLPALFSDNMILQQGPAANIWGWADTGETVTLTFRDEQVTAVASNGQWAATLKHLKPGAPATLTVGTKTATLLRTNVIVGEVWVCSGQSNMEWPLN